MADGKVDLTALGRSQLIERIRKLEHDLELAQDDLRVARAVSAVPVAKLNELLTEWRERLDELIDTWRHRAAVLREEGERAEANGFTACADALELVMSVHATGKE